MPGFVVSPTARHGPAEPGEKIILYFHGGGYLQGHPLWLPFPVNVSHDTGTRVYCAQYRKALSPDTAFPAQLLDALAAWDYVTSPTGLGFAAADVCLMGDSAGGHLALMLAQHLGALVGSDDAGGHSCVTPAPVPGGLALISPWADMTLSFPTWETNTDDLLGKSKLALAVRSFARHYTPESLRSPLFSPALAPAGSWSFLRGSAWFVSVGTAEVFEGEDAALAEGMRADGIDVQVFSDLGGLHIGPVWPFAWLAAYNGCVEGIRGVLHSMKSPARGGS